MHADYFWFGTNQLWTQLPKDGTWQGLSQWADGTFRQKISWLRDGYSWRRDRQPRLQITGQRVDPLRAPHGNCLMLPATAGPMAEHPFIVSAIKLPTLVCWKLTMKLQS